MELSDLLSRVYNEIQERNKVWQKQPVPLSDEFWDVLASKLDIVPFTIPKLMKILVNCHRIFSFPVVEEDRRKKILSVEGYVVAEGPVIKSMKEYYANELARLYAIEFNKKLPPEKAVKEFIPLMGEMNNTELGRAGNIAVMLEQTEVKFERSILDYSAKWQEKQLANELKVAEPVSYFLGSDGGDPADDLPRPPGPASRRAERPRPPSDQQRVSDYQKFASRESIEKTIAVYGVEFYTKICFRDYQFYNIQNLVESDVIRTKEDLQAVKKMLQKERAAADQDEMLQRYASEINTLERCVNEKLRHLG